MRSRQTMMCPFRLRFETPRRFGRKGRKERKTKMNRMMTVGAIVTVMAEPLAGTLEMF